VHLLGHPARIDELVPVAAALGVPTIEDASEALGATYSAGSFAGRHVGTIGRVGCFSFNGNKLITTGGGGMLTTDDETFARRARHLSTQARRPGRFYWHEEIGYNYRLTNLAAAVGLAQLEQLPELLAGRRRNAARYDAGIATIPWLRPAVRTGWADPSFWLYTARREDPGPDRDSLIDALAAEAIEARPIWTPLHLMGLFADAPRLGGAVAERIFADSLSLPSSSSLTDEESERTLRALEAAAPTAATGA
jgi:dTDP-4-amino-4,6-dideoxygalactose transaminase